MDDSVTLVQLEVNLPRNVLWFKKSQKTTNYRVHYICWSTPFVPLLKYLKYLRNVGDFVCLIGERFVIWKILCLAEEMEKECLGWRLPLNARRVDRPGVVRGHMSIYLRILLWFPDLVKRVVVKPNVIHWYLWVYPCYRCSRFSIIVKIWTVSRKQSGENSHEFSCLIRESLHWCGLLLVDVWPQIKSHDRDIARGRRSQWHDYQSASCRPSRVGWFQGPFSDPASWQRCPSIFTTTGNRIDFLLIWFVRNLYWKMLESKICLSKNYYISIFFNKSSSLEHVNYWH